MQKASQSYKLNRPPPEKEKFMAIEVIEKTPVITEQIVGSPLSDILIRAHMEAGNIIVSPFKEKNLQSSSYDVSLGRYFYSEQDPGFGMRLFNPYSQRHVEQVWGKKWQEATRARILMEQWPHEADWENISPDDEVILFEPGKTYLCHTEEFIGFRNVGTTMMKARSTLGRDFTEVCKCAGWGDNGYINRWTMEVTNNSTRYTIPLIVGTRVAQIIFFYTGETNKPYDKTGNYQTTDDIEEMVKNWSPRSMLPRLTK